MDAKIDGLRLNMSGLIAGSNEVNAKVCAPAARRIAQRVSAGGGRPRVETHTRTSAGNFARTRVVDDSPDVHRREARNGTMARSMGG